MWSEDTPRNPETDDSADARQPGQARGSAGETDPGEMETRDATGSSYAPEARGAPLSDQERLASPPAEREEPEDIEPPSAGFIVQLFLLPAVIVGVIVLLWVGFGKIATGYRSVEDYIAGLQSSEPKWRWTTAHELAVRLQNDRDLASDASLAAELKRLLISANRDRSDSDPGDEATTFRAFLIRALARMRVYGILDPIVDAALHDPVAEVRAAAIWALTERAQNEFAASERSQIARTLCEAVDDPSPEVRRFVAYGLGTLSSDAAAVLDALRQLAHDADRETRFNAAAALARKGNVSAVTTLVEMLHTADLKKSGMDDEFAAYVTEQALNALREAVRQGARLDDPQLREAVKLVASSENPRLSSAARDLLLRIE